MNDNTLSFRRHQAPKRGNLKNYIPIERGSDMIFEAPSEVNDTILTIGEKSFYTGQNPIFLYFSIICLILYSLLMLISIWRYKNNKTPKF